MSDLLTAHRSASYDSSSDSSVKFVDATLHPNTFQFNGPWSLLNCPRTAAQVNDERMAAQRCLYKAFSKL